MYGESKNFSHCSTNKWKMKELMGNGGVGLEKRLPEDDIHRREGRKRGPDCGDGS
jgi:hypothetical protein